MAPVALATGASATTVRVAVTPGASIDEQRHPDGTAPDDDATTAHLTAETAGGDAALLRATGAGSRQAFAALMRRYVAAVYAWTASRSSSPDEATRRTAAVFRDVRDRAATAPVDCDVDVWILGVCRRSVGPTATDGEDGAPTVEDLDAVWVGAKVRTALGTLTARRRAALESPEPPMTASAVTGACTALHEALVRDGVRTSTADGPARPEGGTTAPVCDRSDEVGPYLLGAATGDAATDFRRHLESCSACRDRCAQLDGLAELLDAARLAADPPPGLVESVLAEVPAAPGNPAGTPRRAARRTPQQDDFVFTPEHDRPRRGTARKLRTALALLLAGAVGAALLFAALRISSERTPTVAFEAVGAGASGTAAVTPNASGNAVTVDARGLRPGRYDAVVTTPDGRAVGAGTFNVGEDGTVRVRLQTAAVSGILEIRDDGGAVLRTRLAD